MKKKTEPMAQSEKILLAAFKTISSKGYGNVSMRNIADDAGVALSQLNYYYKNKEGLLTEVVKLMTNKYLLEVEAQLKKGATAREKFTSLTAYFKQMLASNPEHFRLLYDLSGMALWSSTFSALVRKLFSDIADLIEKYVFGSAEPKAAAAEYPAKSINRMVLGTLLGVSLQAMMDPEEQIPDSLDALEMVWE